MESTEVCSMTSFCGSEHPETQHEENAQTQTTKRRTRLGNT
ncbi:hypothetical protein RSSM_05581 [Rhodopirellula sallentina SM41]|uniref:Uncharacterized protein n=1 Tax=Rhodopirellula sallentina SM41 TaxID=1263870 RepID=M5UAD5_9BACT|nr:hypothetical protein RSSM_05581 [Rhodopirellula sallentina SM41]